MHLARHILIVLLAGLLCGCRRSAPTTPQPSPVPTALTKETNQAIAGAVQYLLQHQSPDGAWRSQTYGFLKDGASLTPSVQRRTGIVIVGAGIAGLSVARSLIGAGINDFALLDLEDAPGGNSRAAFASAR